MPNFIKKLLGWFALLRSRSPESLQRLIEQRNREAARIYRQGGYTHVERLYVALIKYYGPDTLAADQTFLAIAAHLRDDQLNAFIRDHVDLSSSRDMHFFHRLHQASREIIRGHVDANAFTTGLTDHVDDPELLMSRLRHWIRSVAPSMLSNCPEEKILEIYYFPK